MLVEYQQLLNWRTVSTVILRGHHILVENVGDSTAVLGECHCTIWDLSSAIYNIVACLALCSGNIINMHDCTYQQSQSWTCLGLFSLV